MQCPACSEPLIVLELNEIEIDYCTGCGGIWLDSGELELLLEGSAQKDELLASFKKDPQHEEKHIKCPICRSKMNKVLVDSEHKITLDECKKECGLWFDKGELHDVIKLGSEADENKVVKLLHEMFEFKNKSS
jgi:Zn-finger nucleic acid-binding protein